MLAHRLALQLDIEDPEQWLEDVPDRVIENWSAYEANEPFGGEYALLARIASMLFVIATKDGTSADAVWKASTMMMGQFMPCNWVGHPEPKTEEQSIGEIENMLAARYG